MSIADRALAAHNAEQEAKHLRNEAVAVENHAQAYDDIARQADIFGIHVDADALTEGWPAGKRWNFTVQVDDDLTLSFEWRAGNGVTTRHQLTMRTNVSDQLYWDLPPGQLTKGPGGGVYGCYHLEGIGKESKEMTLAELGECIARVREARRQWKVKHLGGE